MSIRVLHLISGFNGGIASFVKNKARALVDTDVIFDILAFHEAPDSFKSLINSMGGNIYQMPNPKNSGYKSFFSSINKVMKNKEYDLIHCHFRGVRALLFYIAALQNGHKRFALHAHSALKPTGKDTISEKIDKYINTNIAKEKMSCSRKASLAYFTKKSVENENIVYIPNSIDPEPFLEEKNRDNLRTKLLDDRYKDYLILGHVGRFEDAKNHEFIIKIAKELMKYRKDFLILLVGDGTKLESIKKLVSDNNLNDNIKFLGHRNDIADIYKLMDYFLLPSKYEGLPTVVIEAQASGVPSLISDEIARETDLGMNLVDFLPINGSDTEKIWVEQINSNKYPILDPELRLNILKEKNFTNAGSANLYLEYLKSKT